MVVSKIINNSIAYYCLHSEVAYSNSEIRILSIIDSASAFLSKSVFDPICQDVLKDTHSSTFVFDFDGIDTVQLNVIEEEISKLCNVYHKKIVLANIKENIIVQSKSFAFFVDDNKEYLNEGPFGFYTYFSFHKSDCDQLSNCEMVFNQVIKDKLKKYIKKKRIEHHSSSVYLSAYIDIKQFITFDKPFFLYCIYRLAQKIRINKVWNNAFESDDKPILICQSLNGSFIASVLSSLLNLDMFIIDSIGPINKLYRSLGATIQSGKKYIVVSDVVCLGTEVKITKNIIEYLGGKYCGNVSIVRIASIKDYDNIESVFYIEKKNKKEFDYQIITPLDE